MIRKLRVVPLLNGGSKKQFSSYRPVKLYINTIKIYHSTCSVVLKHG